MPSRTLEDKVEELTKVTSITATRVDGFEDDLARLISEHAETARSVAELKTSVTLLSEQVADLKVWKEAGVLAREAIKVEIALVKKEVEDLKHWRDETKKQQEEWRRKWWMIVPPVIAALLSSTLLAVITYFLKK